MFMRSSLFFYKGNKLVPKDKWVDDFAAKVTSDSANEHKHDSAHGMRI